MNLRIRHKGLYPQYEREKLSISDWGRWLAKEGETGTHTVNLYQAVLCGWHPTLFSGFWEKITLAQAGYNRRNSSLLPLPGNWPPPVWGIWYPGALGSSSHCIGILRSRKPEIILFIVPSLHVVQSCSLRTVPPGSWIFSPQFTQWR